VPFPLGEWIDAHDACRHNLGISGMRGTVGHPRPTDAAVSRADPEELRRALADRLGVEPGRVFLTPGASDANGRVLFFLARRTRRRAPRARVRYPEYPPLFDSARWAGFHLDGTREHRPATLALVSNPRNPEGDRWTEEELLEWSRRADHLLVDETFREFARAPSVHGLPRRGVWTTGSFTKYYAGDDLRVGFVVAPEEERDAFAEYHGLVADQLSEYSVAGALATLQDRRIRSEIERVIDRNRSAFRRAYLGRAPPVAPLFFDRSPRDGERCAYRAIRSSVLVCPGGFFGDATGVRVCLTRRSFPEDLRAYLRVRGPPLSD